MKIEELSKALSNIERCEDDVYDVVLCVHRPNGDSRVGYLLSDMPFNLLAGTLIPILKENYENENCMIDLSQGILHKDMLYITIFVFRTMSFPDRTD